MGNRSWIKIYVDPWLNGSIRNLRTIERGIWIDLLVMAGNSAYGAQGLVGLTRKQGLQDASYAQLFGISLRKWQQVKQSFRALDMIKVYNNKEYKNILIITNWNKYQSEYNRQKSYRDKLHNQVTNPIPQSYSRDVDIDKDKKKKYKQHEFYSKKNKKTGDLDHENKKKTEPY